MAGRLSVCALLLVVAPKVSIAQEVPEHRQIEAIKVLRTAAEFVRVVEPNRDLRIDSDQFAYPLAVAAVAEHLGASTGSFNETFECPERLRCRSKDGVEVVFSLGGSPN